MSEKLKELFPGAKIIKLPSLDPEIERALQESCGNFNRALKRSEESSKIPDINSCGKCPSCGSRNYFPLWGGSCDKQCADCKTAYDCVNMEGCHE